MTIYQENEVPFRPTYLYIKQHAMTGKMYFGKTASKDVEKYLGSGVHWTCHIKKHGKEHVVTLWYELYEDRDAMIEFASTFSRELDIVESNSWLNLMFEDGIGGGNAGFTEETLERCRNAGRFKRTPEQCANMSAGQQGKVISAKGRMNMSTAATGRKQSPEMIAKRSATRKALPKIKCTVVICPHCGKTGSRSNMARYHFDNCKHNPMNDGIAKNRKVQKDICCPHCGKIGKPGGMDTYHFDNCKHNPLNSGIAINNNVSKKVTCPNCGKTGGNGPMQRYHFDNCKTLKNSKV